MASDFEQYGLSAIKRVRSRYPAIYLKICAMMLPKGIQVKEDAISRLSDEQLDEYLQIVRDLERIPVTFKHSPHDGRSSCILVG